MKDDKPLYYSDYLELEKVLTAQHPKSASQLTIPSHDETLFIIVHQAFELWFLQIIHELKSVNQFLSKEYIDDNSEELSRIVQRLDRIVRILRLLIQQFEILETMQPLDFLEFRGLLAPASGFQSKQFRIIEAMIGLKMNSRHMPEHYKNTSTHKGGFSEQDYDDISEAENGPSLLRGLKNWLTRMPYFNNSYWTDYEPTYPNRATDNLFLSDYFNIYKELQKDNRDIIVHDETASPEAKKQAKETYQKAINQFEDVFLKNGTSTFSAGEISSALFIMLYRHLPLLRQPFQFLNYLIEIDELLSTWRYKHYLVVRKMIGSKPGTGGSPGAEYLMGALQKNNVFNDLTILATYFIERDKLPVLPDNLKTSLTF